MKKILIKKTKIASDVVSDKDIIKVASKENLLNPLSKERFNRELGEVTKKCNSIIALISQRKIKSKEFGNQQQFHDQIKSVMKTLTQIYKITINSSIEPKAKSKKEVVYGPKEEGK
jgi:hypothetical protein